MSLYYAEGAGGRVREVLKKMAAPRERSSGRPSLAPSDTSGCVAARSSFERRCNAGLAAKRNHCIVTNLRGSAPDCADEEAATRGPVSLGDVSLDAPRLSTLI
jgi:hypothetical protein